MTPEAGAVLGRVLLIGAAMGAYYDVFRALRRVFRFSYAAVCAQDVFFFVSSSIAAFFCCIWINDGLVRASFIIAMFAGWAVYAATVGAVLMAVLDRMLGAAGSAAEWLRERLARRRDAAEKK